MENEWLDVVKRSAPSKTEEETTNDRLRAMDAGALTILGTSALIDG
jgi:hypothetical protein